MVGGLVEEVCLVVLNGGDSIKELNNMIITLISKVTKDDKMSDFRPISLCNVIYKVISRCLVERLKETMVITISENQSAFVGGRQIFGNVNDLF